jgi:serine/threonine protein kinase
VKQSPLIDEEKKRRFEENVEIWRKCQKLTNSIVSYIEHFYKGEYLFVVMEYCSNGDVEMSINQKKENGSNFSETVFFIYLPMYVYVLIVKEIRNFIFEVGLGLSTFHFHRFMHRDIKPANIFISIDYHYKIGFFDLFIFQCFFN